MTQPSDKTIFGDMLVKMRLKFLEELSEDKESYRKCCEQFNESLKFGRNREKLSELL